jgi:protoheme IX farnesyltransferase
MQRLSIPALTYATKTYCSLTKPGIILGNLITAAGGFALASRKQFDVRLFLATLVGLSLIIASACVFNNFIDRDLDEKMARTQHRALVKGLITPHCAITFAIFLGLLGTFLLMLFVNLLTVGIALFGFFVYVVLYSFSKYRSTHGTLIGSIAGAVPPVVGYCAVSHHFDGGALLLFMMIAMWQMPHFFAIAIYRLEDYSNASIPVLPIKKGMRMTKIQMLLYIIAFMTISLMLTLFHYTGYLYLIVTALLGIAWIWLCIRGFTCSNDQLWARKMFFFSLIVVTALCFVIPLDVKAASSNDQSSVWRANYPHALPIAGL